MVDQVIVGVSAVVLGAFSIWLLLALGRLVKNVVYGIPSVVEDVRYAWWGRKGVLATCGCEIRRRDGVDVRLDLWSHSSSLGSEWVLRCKECAKNLTHRRKHQPPWRKNQ